MVRFGLMEKYEGTNTSLYACCHCGAPFVMIRHLQRGTFVFVQKCEGSYDMDLVPTNIAHFDNGDAAKCSYCNQYSYIPEE